MKAGNPNSERSAGILLPLFSLPSPFGIGDLGSELNRFADFLHRSRQTYWQLLPLNPTEIGSGNSPYSSISSMALNTLFISPELLVEEGLLDKGHLETLKLPVEQYVDYAIAEKLKQALYGEAYDRFCEGRFENLKADFNSFCNKEEDWLNDFAAYAVLKKHFKNRPWYQWPDEYKKRNTTTLDEFAKEYDADIAKIKWLQFIVARQWNNAKMYCNSRGIKVFGDLPFYVSHDSADVWAHPEIFKVDEAGNMTGIAGVPPDYFSATGQLWGMPIYNWEKLKAENYRWWIDRLKKNLELFDVLRLDHFRAFESYWDVPAGSENAINGTWIKGPGTDFFDVAREALSGLPFVAEDLGYEMQEVYKLRDKINLPGMKVLQFAWGDNMPISVDTPHNYPVNCVVYTGTHDNDTTKGWFREETGNAMRERLEQYTGMPINEEDVDEVLWRMAYASVAQTAIIPIQDILRLEADSRINTPGKATGNWQWRLSADMLTPAVEAQLLDWVKMYNRL